MRGLVLILAFCTPVFADPAKWEISRTTAPESIDELKALQNVVKAMVEKTTPATVALHYEMGSGSGVIVSEDGLILTAAHVISRMTGGPRRGGGLAPDSKDTPPESRFCQVLLSDGTTVKGEVLGKNQRNDTGMVKIVSKVPEKAKWPGASEGKWPAISLGKSADLKKGQWVVSLGHPGGPKTERRAPVRLGQLVSVSKTGNRVSSDCTLVGGDSGGPLFDLDGKLIGIHTSISLELTQNFHIPVHTFEGEWARLTRGDRMGYNNDAYIGFILKGEGDRKVKPIIEEVKRGTPADNAGLEENDLILELNGHTVKTSEDVDQIMTGLRVGQTVLIKVKRGDDTYELEIVLAKRK